MDEVNLTDLHNLDGDEERDRDEHLSTRMKTELLIDTTVLDKSSTDAAGNASAKKKTCTIETLHC